MYMIIDKENYVILRFIYFFSLIEVIALYSSIFHYGKIVNIFYTRNFN